MRHGLSALLLALGFLVAAPAFADSRASGDIEQSQRTGDSPMGMETVGETSGPIAISDRPGSFYLEVGPWTLIGLFIVIVLYLRHRRRKRRFMHDGD